MSESCEKCGGLILPSDSAQALVVGKDAAYYHAHCWEGPWPPPVSLMRRIIRNRGVQPDKNATQKDRVHLEVAWCDGFLEGIADVHGALHRYVFYEEHDKGLGVYQIWPIKEEELALEIACRGVHHQAVSVIDRVVSRALEKMRKIPEVTRFAVAYMAEPEEPDSTYFRWELIDERGGGMSGKDRTTHVVADAKDHKGEKR